MQDKKQTESQEHSLQKEGQEKRRKGLWIIPVSVCTMGVIFLLIGLLLISLSQDMLRHRETETEEKEAAVTETVISETEQRKAEAKTEEEAESTGLDDRSAEETSWRETIFGEVKNGIVSQQITVSGLSAEEKTQLGFVESDFIRMLSSFLTAQQIRTDQVTFTERISCSSENAAAYRVSLAGIEDQVLQVILFPDYAGSYLLTLQESVTVNIPLQETGGQNGTGQGGSSQTEAQVQQPSVIYVPQQTESEPKNTYDASTLSILNIPETLLNYINNKYELQYSMYRYLYDRGYTNVTSAAVSDYGIDASNRTATIRFELSNGGKLTGIYHKDTNTYVYE